MTNHMPDATNAHSRQLAGYARTNGIMLPRLVAYVIDIFIVGLFSLLVGMGVTFLGLLTFGLGWLLFPIVGICTAMAYGAITIGGPNQATLGMRVAGIEVEASDGGPPEGLTAAAHCLLFYVATFTIGLLVLNIAIGLLREDGRMGHDLLTGLSFVRD